MEPATLKPANRRLRDYTPTALATEPASGGADIFLEFLAETLWPALAARQPVQVDLRGIAGHSLGSLLVLHALFQRMPFFSRFLASAPSLWWNDRALLCQAGRLQRSGRPLPARLFLGVGENDTPSMTGDLEMLESQLAAQPFPQLEVISRRFPGRDHYDVLPECFAEGLRCFTRDRRWGNGAKQNGPHGITRPQMARTNPETRRYRRS